MPGGDEGGEAPFSAIQAGAVSPPASGDTARPPGWPPPAAHASAPGRPTSSTSSARRPRSVARVRGGHGTSGRWPTAGAPSPRARAGGRRRAGARRPIGRPSRRSRAGFVDCRQQVRMVPAREGRPQERRTKPPDVVRTPGVGRPGAVSAAVRRRPSVLLDRPRRRPRRPRRPQRPAPPGRHGDGAQPREVRIVVQGDEARELLPGEGARGRESARRAPPRPCPSSGRRGRRRAPAPRAPPPRPRPTPGPAGPRRGAGRRRRRPAGPGGRPRRPRRSGPRAAGHPVAGAHET